MRFQGIGTDFYGKRNYNPRDKSYITTKWWVFFLLPILPLKSYRVIKGYESEKFYGIAFSGIQQYKILEEIPLKKNQRQILFTYLSTYGGLGLLLSSIYLSFTYPLMILVPVGLVIVFLIWYFARYK